MGTVSSGYSSGNEKVGEGLLYEALTHFLHEIGEEVEEVEEVEEAERICEKGLFSGSESSTLCSDLFMMEIRGVQVKQIDKQHPQFAVTSS